VVRFGVLVLPVVLGDVKGSCHRESWELEWQTFSEIDSDYFLIQASHDGVVFNTIATESAAVVSQHTLNYYTNGQGWKPEWNYLRLALRHLDGEVEALQTIYLNCFATAQKGELFPNPTTDLITFRGDILKMIVFNSLGQQQSTADLSTLQDQFIWNTGEWPRGIYHVMIYNGKQWDSYKLSKL
jgi:hypothetical protein